MSGIEEAVAGGVAGPIIQPLVRWVVKRVNRSQQVARYAPALVLNYRTYNCDHVEEWLAQADALLRSDGWLKQEFWDREVQLRRIGSALVAHGYWQESDAWHFDGRSIEVLGPQSPRKRLSIVLWASSRRDFAKTRGIQWRIESSSGITNTTSGCGNSGGWCDRCAFSRGS